MHIYKTGRMNDGLSAHTPRFPSIFCSYTQRSTVPHLLSPLFVGNLLLLSSVRSLPLRQGIMHRERQLPTARTHGSGERCYPSLSSLRPSWCGSSTTDHNNLLQRIKILLIASLLEVKPAYAALHYRALVILAFSLPFSLEISGKRFFC